VLPKYIYTIFTHPNVKHLKETEVWCQGQNSGSLCIISFRV